MPDEKSYIAIDLKSFYASAECVARGLDPLKANLVVADESRTDKTICLAVSPPLKSYGIPGRARLFEVKQAVERINAVRRINAPEKRFSGSSFMNPEVLADSSLELDFVIARPRMAEYLKISASIYDVYLKYISPDDIHVYSIDEVFIDATPYLALYNISAYDLAMKMIKDVLFRTGITATAGIGTNLYLSKIAMDIDAKHMPADEYGVRISELNETTYRERLWNHRPITDFWRIGSGTARRLAKYGLDTMGKVARFSIDNEDRLYRLFGINAELLIDHAWGVEPVEISDIKAFKPVNSSLSSGQVLKEPYIFDKARLIVKEMTDALVLDMVEKRLVTDRMELTVCYDGSCLTDPEIKKYYKGPVVNDYYGRPAPKAAHGTVNLGRFVSSTKIITAEVDALFERIADRGLLVRRIYVVAGHVIRESDIPADSGFEQLDMFTDYGEKQRLREEDEQNMQKEKALQRAVLDIKNRYGRNAILKAMNFEEGATAAERNESIGGHKA